MKVNFTEEQHMRIIEILEDEMFRQQKIYERRMMNRIEQGRLEELNELIEVLRSAKK
jgi:hypothetical protein